MRLEARLDRQLDPGALDDSDLAQRRAAAGFTAFRKSLAQLWQDHVASDPPWDVRMRPYGATERATSLRAIHGHYQLVEVLGGFWYAHFDVYGPDVGARRPRRDPRHLLGNFRPMLEAVARGPAMLYDLDNDPSSNASPNESYARELRRPRQERRARCRLGRARRVGQREPTYLRRFPAWRRRELPERFLGTPTRTRA